eukprot:CAMPEP_0181328210 /NCGR_PEP_ID=MMETSP1101-20121128/22572_1 /TAXON_ID=46948 /ORGANISM="Rhodomonas abbreviata, Strain Caron Lab Isolate" /LENGTH=131 /DNA_ID=CAMNT_0023437039 /DNA_START=114 /DNA_END=509 /DNA_ORIENTATION=+
MSKVIQSTLAARSAVTWIPSSSKAAGVRFGSSWAHNNMHGSKLFDTKFTVMSTMAKQRGVTIRKPTTPKKASGFAPNEMLAIGGLFMSLSGATAYLSSLQSQEANSKPKNESSKTSGARSFAPQQGMRLAM